MLGRQLWRPRSTRVFEPPSTTSLPQDRIRSGRFFNDRGLSNVLSTNNDTFNLTTNLADESRSTHRRQSTVIPSLRWKHSSVLRRLEPWIDPHSLSNSLEAHRQANRDGNARDGVPVQSQKRSRRKSFKPSPKTGPWMGMNVLHLKIPKSVQQPEGKYDGICPPLLTEWRFKEALPMQLKFPWMPVLQSQDGDSAVRPALEQLNAEVRAWGAYLAPTKTERQAAVNAFEDITKVLRHFLTPDIKIDLVGSRAAGTDCPTSDLDIDINLRSELNADYPERSNRKELRKLYQHMFRDEFKHILLPHAYIEWARVPVIVGTHVPTGLEFQIQSTASAYDSLEVAKAFVAEYPSARVLFMLVKQMLAMRGLTRGNYGGITSYPLLNMVVTSLKMAGPHIATDDVGRQLLYFLDFWSEFSFRQHKIAMASTSHESTNRRDSGTLIDPISSTPRIVPKQVKEPQSDYKMSMEDPADPSNDLGKSTNGIKHVQACFIMARYSINRSLSEWGIPSAAHEDQEGRSLLGGVLGGNYTSFEEARWQLRRFCEQKVKNIA